MLTCRGHPTKCATPSASGRCSADRLGIAARRSTSPAQRWSSIRHRAASSCGGTRAQHAWLQVGGHGDPGEDDPFAVALREAGEETGLSDLVAWPDERRAPVHLVIVPVPEGKGEPAHEHADIRYVLSTADPDSARPESDDAPMQWLTLDEAFALSAEDNLHETLRRVVELLGRLAAAFRFASAGAPRFARQSVLRAPGRRTAAAVMS